MGNNGIGPFNIYCDSDPRPNRPTGVFDYDSRITFAHISDGTSNTVFVSELITVPGMDLRGMLHFAEGGFYHHNYTPNATQPDSVRQNCCVSTKEAPCVEGYPDWTARRVIYTARSYHSGGVNMLLGDGSVKFVTNGISQQTWQAASSPNGGEVLGNDW